MAEKYILTHDLGTSGNKAVLFNLDLEVIAHTKVDYPIYYPTLGCAEQYAKEYWNAVKKATSILIQQNNTISNDILALVFDCQMNCTIPIDKTGNPLMNCISWLDTRAAPITSKFSKGIIKISGYGLRTILMFLKITGGAP
ncbi:MAG: FGGY family carbohydrate kinase, partial [Promethearchaeota archaeon]